MPPGRPPSPPKLAQSRRRAKSQSLWEAESDVVPAPLLAHKAAQARILPRRRSLLHVLGIALLAFGLSLLLYFVTLAPTVGAGSAANLQFDAHRMEVGGGAANHPLSVALGHLATRMPILIGDEAYRVNLASALIAALALTIVFLCTLSILDVSQLGGTAWGRVLFAGVGTASLALSHGFWSRAVVADPTPLNVLLLALTIWLFGARMNGRGAWTVILGTITYSLLVTNQRSMIVLAPLVLGVGVGLLARPPARSAARATVLVALAFVGGLVPLSLLEAHDFSRIGSSLLTIRDFAFRAAGLPRDLRAPAPALATFGLRMVGSFLLASVLAVAGLVILPMRSDTRKIAAFLFGLAITAALSSILVSYSTAAAAWIPIAIWVAAGAAVLGRRATPLVAAALILGVAVLPPIAYALWPRITAHPKIHPLAERAIVIAAPAGRTTFAGPAAPLHPWRRSDRAARLQATALLSAVPPHTLLVTDGATTATLRYLITVEGLGPSDLAVVDGDSLADPGGLFRAHLGEHPLAVAGLTGDSLDRIRRVSWLDTQGPLAFAYARPEVLTAADRHFEARNYGQAALLYGEALLTGTERGGTPRTEDPESVARWAVALTQCRFPELAAQVTGTLLAASRDTAGTHLRLGELFVATGATTWAENHFAEALAADPDPSEAAYLNGRIAELRGDRDGARRAYRRTLGFDPTHGGARAGLERLRKVKDVPSEGGKRSAHVTSPHAKDHG